MQDDVQSYQADTCVCLGVLGAGRCGADSKGGGVLLWLSAYILTSLHPPPTHEQVGAKIFRYLH